MSKIRLTAALALMTPHRIRRVRKLLPVPDLPKMPFERSTKRRRSRQTGHVHVDRLADLEVVLAVVAAEDALEVLERGFGHAREVRRNGARRPRHQVGLVEVDVGGQIGQHQLGLELDQRVGGRAAEHLAQEHVDVAGIARRVAQHVGVGRVELDVGDQAEVLVLLADDLDELAQPHVLDRHGRVEARRQALGDRAGDSRPERGAASVDHVDLDRRQAAPQDGGQARVVGAQQLRQLAAGQLQELAAVAHSGAAV